MSAPNGLTNINGFVLDSLTNTPLANAGVAFARSTVARDSETSAVTDANGRFNVSLPAGTWIASVQHPLLDSLHVLAPPTRADIPNVATHELHLWTPSRVALVKAMCGDNRRADDLVVAGFVRDATTRMGIGGAKVFVKWVDLILTLHGTARATRGQVVATGTDGRYVSCGVPVEGQLVSWAEKRGATTGAVLMDLARSPARLDFYLDTTARPSRGSVDLDPDSTGDPLFPMSVGRASYRIAVRDGAGGRVVDAQVRVFGRAPVRTDSAGVATLDSVPNGTQTIEVLARGFQPLSSRLALSGTGERTDTVKLTPLTSVLGVLRSAAGGDPTGFFIRRSRGAGQFISGDEIAREKPTSIARLLGSKKGLRLVGDVDAPRLEASSLPFACAPHVFVDGFILPPVASIPGRSDLDVLLRLEDVGGVEIYATPAEIPSEIAQVAPGRMCAAIVVWTRGRLNPSN
jgi:hypothetical protein